MQSRYSEKLMEHFLEPYHRGPMESPLATGVAGCPGRGPYLVFQIQCDGTTITEAAFQSHNCGVTVACGSALCEMVEGRTLEECLQITARDLQEFLNGVPVEKQNVPLMAVDVLQQAIAEVVP